MNQTTLIVRGRKHNCGEKWAIGLLAITDRVQHKNETLIHVYTIQGK